jgi:hypothetical protein
MPKLKRNPPPLACGDCTVCCSIMAVDDLPAAKPNWVPCAHVCRTGCRIYRTRPPSCRSFQCLWLQGHLGRDPAQRPDRLGVMFTVADADNVLGRPVLVAWEVWDGGFARAEAMLTAMAREGVLVLRRPDGLALRGMPAALAEVEARWPTWREERRR